MHKCPIGFGKYSNLHCYILFCMLCAFFYDTIFGIMANKKKKFNILFFEPIISLHPLIKSLYKYLGNIFFSIIFFYFYFNKNNKENTLVDNKYSITKYELIYNKKNYINNNDKLELLLICFSLAFFLEFIDIMYSFNFHDLDLWITNIFFISMFMSHYYKINLYSHQKLSLSLSCFFNLIILIFSSLYPFEKDTAYETTESLFKSKFFCILICILFILISCLVSLSRVKIKILMDVKDISPIQIVFFTGCFGLFLNLICLIFSSIFKCKNEYLADNFCNLNKNYTNNTYYESLPIYFSNLKERFDSNKILFFIEIFVVYPLTSFLFFMKYLFEILMIYYLNPIYILVSDGFYYTILYLLALIANYFDRNEYQTKFRKFALLFTGNILSVFFYLVYLEMIELRFCGLDKNLRRKINERGVNEVNSILGLYDNNSDDDNESGDKEGKGKIEFSAF